MPFVLREPASSPPVLRVWGWWGGGGQVQRREGPGPPAPFCSPCPGLTAGPAPRRAPPRPAPRPRQVEARRPAAARTVSPALPTAAGSTAAGRSSATQCSSRGLPGDAAHSPGADSAVNCRRPPHPPLVLPAPALTVCVLVLRRRPGPTPGPRAEARSLGDCWFLLAVEGTG